MSVWSILACESMESVVFFGCYCQCVYPTVWVFSDGLMECASPNALCGNDTMVLSVQMSDATCSICGSAFQSEDVVPLIGTPDQVQTQQEMVAERRRLKGRRKPEEGKRKKEKREYHPGPETNGPECSESCPSAKRRQ